MHRKKNRYCSLSEQNYIVTIKFAIVRQQQMLLKNKKKELTYRQGVRFFIKDVQ